MPTGYTADVADGKVADFRTFALRCARAFGAAIMQRDDPMDEPPKHREPSTYHEEQLQAALDRMAALRAMTGDEAEQAAGAEYDRADADYKQSVVRQTEIRNRYNAMLAAVMEWTAPTPDHDGLRKFMIDQLTESRRFDAYEPTPPVRLSGAAWRTKEQKAAAWNISYHVEEGRKDRERCASANAWIDALYASLPATTTAPAVEAR